MSDKEITWPRGYDQELSALLVAQSRPSPDDHQPCESIPILPVEGFGVPTESSDCSNDRASRALYDEVVPKIVRVEANDQPASQSAERDIKVGTGFFVNNGDEVVTNVHVARAGQFVDILTNDGRRYPAKIEKVDETNDLALLKVEGIARDKGRALTPAPSSSLLEKQTVIAFGHPDGSDKVFASAGYYKGQDKLRSLIPDMADYPDLAEIIKYAGSADTKIANEANQYLNGERIHLIINTHHGNSGSPAFDTAGNFIAVAADRLNARHSLFVPGERVKDLLSSPESLFNFVYKTDSNHNEQLVEVQRKDGSKAPLLALGMTPPQP